MSSTFCISTIVVGMSMRKIIRDCENHLEVLRQIQHAAWLEALAGCASGMDSEEPYKRSNLAMQERIRVVEYLNAFLLSEQ